MRTSGILTLGGGFVAFLGGIFSLLMVKAFLVDKGQGFIDLTGLFFGLVVFGAGAAAVIGGRKRAKLEEENDERGFAELAQSLAKKVGGQVGLDAVCKASGLGSDEAQAKMRKLTGTGLFELDFDANGQMVYKLSANPGAAQLAQLAGR